jgi:hypothetical protein
MKTLLCILSATVFAGAGEYCFGSGPYRGSEAARAEYHYNTPPKHIKDQEKLEERKRERALDRAVANKENDEANWADLVTGLKDKGLWDYEAERRANLYKYSVFH